MKIDQARPGNLGQEESFAAEEGVGNAADKLDVVIDGFFESDQAAGIDAEGFARIETSFDNGRAILTFAIL